jgi:hypothetical protein
LKRRLWLGVDWWSQLLVGCDDGKFSNGLWETGRRLQRAEQGDQDLEIRARVYSVVFWEQVA